MLANKYSKEELKKRLYAETFERITLSFYRYIRIENVEQFRDDLYVAFGALGVLGRIYVAHEGINAQLSLPEHNWEAFKDFVNSNEFIKDVPFKIAVEDDGKSFYKLIVRVKEKIVGDGLADGEIDFSDVGKHIEAKELNAALDDPDTIIIDMRNHYESEVGCFENAICPDVDTFRDALPKALELAEGKKDHKIILYCTGGIRCEKAGAYFRHYGFKNVNQLYGGIIAYASQIKVEGLPSKFIGKNFVFDERLGERITNDIISQCHQCGKPCDDHTNCANDDCHLLFIQCEECKERLKGCCTEACMYIIELPIEEQRKLRKGKKKDNAHSVYKSRLRPDLKELYLTTDFSY
ncbi:MAG: rhodanese-related sulfurtransferase [Bacteroidia bacterium]